MHVFELPSNTVYEYIFTGKFQAPSPHWIHQESPLKDYELFVVTEGTLYISYQGEAFTVETGDFLLLPPGGIRKGVRPSAQRKSLTLCFWLTLSPPAKQSLFPDMALFQTWKKL